MKIRVRTPDGRTLKLDAVPEDSVGSLLATALSAWSLSAEPATAMLSLNKKDSLDETSKLSDCGLRGGDLLHLITFGDVQMGEVGVAAGASGPREGSGQQSSGLATAHLPRNPFGLPTVSSICAETVL